ncbi:TPA: hypothetical protein DD690_02935 [Candidatus Daviesbacteria bacterium]|uniref:Antitoxin n=1 Tax=Candidatus Daviesbacteria bacterium GW2011_GWF2_38_6 TaxID=1618432 RepID=A0A0G0MYL8_9BACT|nr:MAG: hypothetical protein US80_C0006G0004 [Candidatus Daviesbacteria bacterium GW2011_GWA2_38_17]KKQ78724.1 MAG: hypothetical protein US99_C0013G0003 [Candidatus Daviesbacteria bacterium GW2011_GWF2_38_6]OGE27030.1 MAG: hypothetical protein A2772_02500 [Candidatus Daviesbacteria bacterium RIFCSPHIGHO2_01_FULL_38_8b]OGE44646.1 MAG: hypothetical protein A3E67_04815 [Candidatus Daviesbacteria bacterium RIFCSPHIGHO2_12_FULL_38_25]OGE68651.1 MAG: hypothetical protein A3H81_00020 [Candidatus Davie
MPQALIISNPQILDGKPVIAGTRISVELILDRVASGMSVKDILKDYPHLNTLQIQAAISYAKDLVQQKSSYAKLRQSEPIVSYANQISR